MRNDIFENSPDPANNRNKISDEKLSMGSTIDKFPVALNDGRTIVYISDQSKEAEIRLKYEMIKDSNIPTRSSRHQR
jgi:hypothetical protein